MLSKKFLKRFYSIIVFAGLISEYQYVIPQATNNNMGANGFALTPEDIEALKATSADSPLGPITDKDIEEFVSFINNLSPEDMQALEGLAQEAAKEIEAAVKEEASKSQPDQNIPTPIIPDAPPKEEKPKIAANKVEEAKNILLNTAKYINDIKQEASKNESVSRRLTVWSKDLNDLVYYLNAILVKDALIAQLLNKDFENLYNNLKKLNKSLEDNIRSFNVADIIGANEDGEEEDPYEILGLDETATEKDIEDAFSAIKKSKDPKVLESKLKAEKIDDKEIKRQIKEAKLSFNLIESAYESLKNSKSRTQIDKELKAKKSTGLTKKEISKKAFASILESFGTAFYDNKILQDFSSLLQKYDPIALKTKQDLEKAESEAKKAREAAAKKNISKSSGSFKDDFGYSGSNYNDYDKAPGYGGYGGYDSPYGDSNRYGDYSDWGSNRKDSESKAASGGGAGVKEAQKEDKDKLQKKEEPKKAQEPQTPEAKPQSPIKLMSEVSTLIDQINNSIEKDPKIAKLLSTTHEVKISPDSTEKTIKRSVPLTSLDQTGLVQITKEAKKSENKADLDYLETWHSKVAPFNKLIEKAENLENLVKDQLEKNPKIKKDLITEFNKNLSGKLNNNITEMLLTTKNVKSNAPSVSNLQDKLDKVYDSLSNVKVLLYQDKDVIGDIKELSRLLYPIQLASKNAQDIQQQIKAAGENIPQDLQANLNSQIKNLEGDRVFFSHIQKIVDRISTVISTSAAGAKHKYGTVWNDDNDNVADKIADLEKLLEIFKESTAQDATIRKYSSNLENLILKLKEIEATLL